MNDNQNLRISFKLQSILNCLRDRARRKCYSFGCSDLLLLHLRHFFAAAVFGIRDVLKDQPLRINTVYRVIPDVEVDVQPVPVARRVPGEVSADVRVVVAKAVIVYYRSCAPEAGAARVMSKNDAANLASRRGGGKRNHEIRRDGMRRHRGFAQLLRRAE